MFTLNGHMLHGELWIAIYGRHALLFECYENAE
jgi:hypothetical protein